MSLQRKCCLKSSAGPSQLAGAACDAVLRVGGAQFPIHKALLSHSSDFFRVMFQRWSAPDQTLFTVSGVSADTMGSMIHFLYSGSVSVRDDNVWNLLQAADYFNVSDMMQACCAHLAEQLCLESCIHLWKFTKSIHPPPPVHGKAFTFIMSHFQELMSSEDFVQLSVQELSVFLEGDQLNIRKERVVFEAIVRWIGLDPGQRGRHMAELLSKVRLALMPLDFIRCEVLTNELVQRDADSLNMVKDAIRTINHILIRPKVRGFRNLPARPRLPNVAMLACGKVTGRFPFNIIMAYDICVDHWVTLSSTLPHRRFYYGVVFLNGFLYCVGGHIAYEITNRVHRFNLSSHTWQEVAPMTDHRYDPAVTVLSGAIYALGGSDGSHKLRSAECLRPEENQWRSIAPMNECRSETSCTAFQNKIYVFGGYNGSHILRSGECYNPKRDQWTLLRPMMWRRAGLGVVANTERVYAVGGRDGQQVLSTVEAYNPRTRAWRTVSPMAKPRQYFGVAVVEDILYVVGGFNGRSFTNRVESYNTQADTWSLTSNTKNLRGAWGCCSVSGLPNMADYLFPRDSLPSLPLWDRRVRVRKQTARYGASVQ
ncbi:kelch-like protein 10 [Synchiropus splendidus]|uniref:kelch-like protein 10 n=1 Tax=Synchiropus splendidus TaxID=270530 RepID=UPI00237EAE94|nr:kelch-like protein 10 [Synchiropus splendidus]